MSKRIISLLLCCILIVALSSINVLASNKTDLDRLNSYNKSNIGDTIRLKQADYLKLNNIPIDQKLSPEEQIEMTCKMFITIGRASVRLPSEYDSTQLIETKSLSNKYNQYRLSEYKYLIAIYKELNQQILSDELVFSDFSATVNGNKASASVVESYTYYKSNRPDQKNFRRRKYTFELNNYPGGWKITKVVTSDPWEVEKNFEYKEINTDQCIQNLRADKLRARTTPIIEEVIPTTRSSLYSWSYYAYKAVEYAESYYDTVNPLFGFTTGKNCQNFASQCVWAGLLGDYASATDRTVFPAISTSYAGSSALNVWCRDQETTYSGYTHYTEKWTWDNIRGFAKRMSLDLSGYEGPNGTVYHGNLLYADRGDVLGIDWDGNGSEDTLDHAMFVTEASGTLGQRTKEDLKIAANTNPSTSAHQDLTDYNSGYLDSAYSTIRIFSGNYSTTDPK